MVIVWCSVALVNGRGLFSVSLQSNLKSERQKINNLILLSAHTLYTATGSSYVGQKNRDTLLCYLRYDDHEWV